MKRRVYVTGLGIVCAIGNNQTEVLSSLLAQKTGVDKLTLFDSINGHLPVGEVKLSNEEMCKILNLKSTTGYTRTSLLGMLAASEAVTNASLEISENKRIGLVSATSVGGMDTSEEFYRDFFKDQNSGKIFQVSTHDNADSTEKIAGHIGVSDFVTTISTACSSSLNSIMLGTRMIQAGMLDCAIVGGTDALTRFTLNGFNSLMILDKEHVRSFDASRAGLNLGEGAAFLVIEAEDVLQGRKDPLCEVVGYGNACDAFHQTATSPEGNGPYISMMQALENANIAPEQIDYVNAHGTGTDNNDLTESIALKRIFGDNVPPFSSTKAYTGHTLGAAGSVETVFSILGMNLGLIFPNLNFKEPISETGLVPVTTLAEKQQFYILTNSFGFGGNDSSVVLSSATRGWDEE